MSETISDNARLPAGNTAREGTIAIREEFDAARARGTAEAWQLFIARHPDHPLAAAAARALAQRDQDREP